MCSFRSEFNSFLEFSHPAQFVCPSPDISQRPTYARSPDISQRPTYDRDRDRDRDSQTDRQLVCLCLSLSLSLSLRLWLKSSHSFFCCLRRCEAPSVRPDQLEEMASMRSLRWSRTPVAQDREAPSMRPVLVAMVLTVEMVLIVAGALEDPWDHTWAARCRGSRRH